jgi:hypothetical protein
MSIWELVTKSLDTLLISLAAVILAILGRAAKLLHEESRGAERLSWRLFLSNLPNALVVGIIAMAVTYTASKYLNVPPYAGVGLGGALGYLGMETVAMMFTKFAERFVTKKSDE